MPKMSATAESATKFEAIDRGTYLGHVLGAPIIQNTKNGTGVMIGIQIELDEGNYRGRRLPGGPNQYMFIMAGGHKVNDAGESSNYDLGRLYDLINGLKASWTCSSCNTDSKAKFVTEKGKYHCPRCGKPANIEFNTDEWNGLRAKWQVDVEKQQDSDEMRNVIKSARAID